MKEVNEEKRISISAKIITIVAIITVAISLVTTLIRFILGFISSYGMGYKIFNSIAVAGNSIVSLMYMAAILYGMALIIKLLYGIKTKKDN